MTVIHTDRIVETLHVAEQGSTLTGSPTPPYLDLLESFTPARLHALGADAPVPPRVSVSRSRLPPGGTLLGERYFEALLAREGWRILHPEQLPLPAPYRGATTILFAEGSAVHGTELLPSVGHCLLLPRRNTESWWIEVDLRGRASRLDVLPRSIPLGTILLDADSDRPIEHLGVSLMDLPNVAASLQHMELAKLTTMRMDAYRRAAREDLSAYIEYRGRADIPPGTRPLASAAMAEFENRCHAAIG